MSIKQKKLELTNEILNQLTKLVIAAFGLVAALSWNDLIKSIFNLYFPSPEGNLLAQLLYAVFITVLVVIITILFARYTKKIKDLLGKK